MDDRVQSAVGSAVGASASDRALEDAQDGGSEFDSKAGSLVYREKQIKPNKIYVGGLPDHTRPDDLQNCFGNIGTIVNIELKIGYGFVEFDNQQAADESIAKYHEGYFMGNKIRVQPCRGGGRYAKVSGVESGACFKCGEQGHWARDCTNHVVFSNNHRGPDHNGSYDYKGGSRGGPPPDGIPPPAHMIPPRNTAPYHDDYGRAGTARNGRRDYPPPRRPTSPSRGYRDYPPPPQRRNVDDYYMRGPPAPPGYDRPYYPVDDGRYPPPRDYGRYPPPPPAPPHDARYAYPPPRSREDRGRDMIPPQGYRGRPLTPPQRYSDYPPPGTGSNGRYRRRSQSPASRTRTGSGNYDAYPPGVAPYAGPPTPKSTPGRDYASGGNGYHRP